MPFGWRLGTEESATEYRAPKGTTQKSVLIIAKQSTHLSDLPDCNRCKQRKACMAAVLAMQPFIKNECNAKLAKKPNHDGQLSLFDLEET